jgi:hypothetical protein
MSVGLKVPRWDFNVIDGLSIDRGVSACSRQMTEPDRQAAIAAFRRAAAMRKVAAIGCFWRNAASSGAAYGSI